MTLLASEATADSRKLLKKHNIEDAKNYSDLEDKLAKLYLNTDDKIALEKELAEIHPHKKWLVKYIMPTPKENIEVEVKEVMASAEGKENKFECPFAKQRHSNCIGFDGSLSNQQQQTQKSYIELIGLVAVVGIVFYAIKNTK